MHSSMRVLQQHYNGYCCTVLQHCSEQQDGEVPKNVAIKVILFFWRESKSSQCGCVHCCIQYRQGKRVQMKLVFKEFQRGNLYWRNLILRWKNEAQLVSMPYVTRGSPCESGIISCVYIHVAQCQHKRISGKSIMLARSQNRSFREVVPSQKQQFRHPAQTKLPLQDLKKNQYQCFKNLNRSRNSKQYIEEVRTLQCSCHPRLNNYLTEGRGSSTYGQESTILR